MKSDGGGAKLGQGRINNRNRSTVDADAGVMILIITLKYPGVALPSTQPLEGYSRRMSWRIAETMHWVLSQNAKQKTLQ